MISLRERLGLDVPIFQAPIGSASCPELVAAVSEAGGLGMLAGTWRPPETLRAAIRSIQAQTGKPFAVNLGMHASPDEKIELCLGEKVPIVSLFWGDGRNHFERIKAAGARAIATVGSASEALRAEEAGADAIIAQGFEAGGHVWGRVSMLPLLAELRDRVKRIPFIAAGGIGDGKSIAVAMKLGAAGACLGTRFLLASESLAHPVYQQLLIGARAEDTHYGEVFELGWPNAPHRVLVNSTVRNVMSAGRTAAEVIARAEDGAAIERYSSRLPTRGMTGEIEAMALYAGQSVGACREIMPARRIVAELMEETREFH